MDAHPKRHITLRVEPALHKRIKHAQAETGKSVQAQCMLWLTQWCEAVEKKYGKEEA